jgi:hypothetical protein
MSVNDKVVSNQKIKLSENIYFADIVKNIQPFQGWRPCGGLLSVRCTHGYSYLSPSGLALGFRVLRF